jgi:hypothetical protein
MDLISSVLAILKLYGEIKKASRSALATGSYDFIPTMGFVWLCSVIPALCPLPRRLQQRAAAYSRRPQDPSSRRTLTFFYNHPLCTKN